MKLWKMKVVATKGISDEELERRCIVAINNGLSREGFYMQLKAERKKIGQIRLYRMWKKLGGPVR